MRGGQFDLSQFLAEAPFEVRELNPERPDPPSLAHYIPLSIAKIRLQCSSCCAASIALATTSPQVGFTTAPLDIPTKRDLRAFLNQ